MQIRSQPPSEKTWPKRPPGVLPRWVILVFALVFPILSGISLWIGYYTVFVNQTWMIETGTRIPDGSGNQIYLMGGFFMLVGTVLLGLTVYFLRLGIGYEEHLRKYTDKIESRTLSKKS